MSFADIPDVQDKIKIDSAFSSLDEATILAALRAIYETPTGRAIVESAGCSGSGWQ
jgi:hypothetical protein